MVISQLFGSTSDIKLKENIKVIPDALDKVKQLKESLLIIKKTAKLVQDL